MDFVARKGDRTVYLQSNYMLVFEQTMRREYASLESIQDNYDKLAKTGLQIILMNYLQFIFYCRYLHPEM